MKKINSIGYGYKILLGAAICLIIIPSVSYFFWQMTNRIQFYLVAKASVVVGIIIFLFLFVLLKIELYQDKKMDEYYMANAQSRLPLKNGLFECQTCGNTQVKPRQKSCIVCGANFKNWSEEDGNKKQR